jgi:hypothetical protein
VTGATFAWRQPDMKRSLFSMRPWSLVLAALLLISTALVPRAFAAPARSVARVNGRTPLYFRDARLRAAIEATGVRLQLARSGRIKAIRRRGAFDAAALAELGYQVVHGKSGMYLRHTVNQGSQIWVEKQDPLVNREQGLGVRQIFLPERVEYGPSDEQFHVVGTAPVARLADGNLMQRRDEIDHDDPEVARAARAQFDAGHAYGKLRRALSRAEGILGFKLHWGFNQRQLDATTGDLLPRLRGRPLRRQLVVMPYGMEQANAFYSPVSGLLAFGYFVPRDVNNMPLAPVYTVRSHDIVDHEGNHAILDAIAPMLMWSNHPETGALHEFFGDWGTIASAIAEDDQREHLMVATRGDLRLPNFVATLGEEFGASLGAGARGLRNADNLFTMANADAEVHDLSQVFTGAIYSTFVGGYEALRRSGKFSPGEAAQRASYQVEKLLLRSFHRNRGVTHLTFARMAETMIALAREDAVTTRGAAWATLLERSFRERRILGKDAITIGPPEGLMTLSARAVEERITHSARSHAESSLGAKHIRIAREERTATAY